MTATQRLRPYGRDMIRHYRRLRSLPEDHRRHREQKQRHLDLVRRDPGPDPDAALLRAITDDGVVVVREFVPREVADKMAADVRPTMETIAATATTDPCARAATT